MFQCVWYSGSVCGGCGGSWLGCRHCRLRGQSSTVGAPVFVHVPCIRIHEVGAQKLLPSFFSLARHNSPEGTGFAERTSAHLRTLQCVSDYPD